MSSFASSLRALLGVSALATLAACQSNVGMSTPCDLNSDCNAPLVCVGGRCQAECVSQLDCIGGTHCAVDGSGLGSCVIDVPLDHTTSPCNGTRACADAALSCRDFSCWSPCTSGADCVPGSYCRAGLCVNPRSRGYGYGLRRECSADGDCGTGEICASDHGSARACRRTCSADTQCTDVAATALCAAIDDPMVPTGTMACVIGCDPVRQQGCLGTDRCEVVTASGASGATATFLECRAPTGMGIQGVACGTDTPTFGSCGVSLGCAPGTDVGSGYECRRFCNVDDDCHSASLACTGNAIDGIQNLDVVPARLGMCAPI